MRLQINLVAQTIINIEIKGVGELPNVFVERQSIHDGDLINNLPRSPIDKASKNRRLVVAHKVTTVNGGMFKMSVR